MTWHARRMAWQTEGMAWHSSRMAGPTDRMTWHARRMAWQTEGMAWHSSRMAGQTEGMAWHARRMAWPLRQEDLVQQPAALRPGTVAALRVEVAGGAGADEPAAPGLGHLAGAAGLDPGIVLAGYEDAGERQRRHRHRAEPRGPLGIDEPLDVGRRHEKRAANLQSGLGRPVRHRHAAEAMGGDHHPRTRFRDGRLQCRHPIRTRRCLPLRLLDAAEPGLRRRPDALPMLGSRVPKPRHEEDPRGIGHGRSVPEPRCSST